MSSSLSLKRFLVYESDNGGLICLKLSWSKSKQWQIKFGRCSVDKKMRKVSKEIRKGEKIIEKAAKKNDRLANYDEKVRDPMIAKYKKLKGKK